MSVSQDENYDVKVEIQKVLTHISDDMTKLKRELSSLNSFIEENSSLPVTAKMVNEKLILAAKDAGIDLENIETIRNISDIEADQAEEDADVEETNDNTVPTLSNASALAADTDQLTKKVKKTLKK